MLNYFHYHPFYGKELMQQFGHSDYRQPYDMNFNYGDFDVYGNISNMHDHWWLTNMYDNFYGNLNRINPNFTIQPHHHEKRKSDHGPNPFVININEAAKKNDTYRTALWTGNYLQVTLMSLHPGEDIGLEIHPDTDQFLRVEQGEGIVQMGTNPNDLNFVKRVSDDSAIMIPARTWHNVTNTGSVPLKLYSIYAPPHHPHGTIHRTKADAFAAEQGFYSSHPNF